MFDVCCSLNVWNMFLFDTSYPDVMMPSYASSRFSAAFFIVYLALVLYFLMNLVSFSSCKKALPEANIFD